MVVRSKHLFDEFTLLIPVSSMRGRVHCLDCSVEMEYKEVI